MPGHGAIFTRNKNQALCLLQTFCCFFSDRIKPSSENMTACVFFRSSPTPLNIQQFREFSSIHFGWRVSLTPNFDAVLFWQLASVMLQVRKEIPKFKFMHQPKLKRISCYKTHTVAYRVYLHQIKELLLTL